MRRERPGSGARSLAVAGSFLLGILLASATARPTGPRPEARPAAAPAVHLCTLAASRLAGGTPCWLLAGLPGEGTAPAPDFGRLALADATGVIQRHHPVLARQGDGRAGTAKDQR